MYGTGISQEVGNGGQVCGDVEAVGFPVQNVYKMTYGDENATVEPVNGYKITLFVCCQLAEKMAEYVKIGGCDLPHGRGLFREALDSPL
jgi:hypothetical protein